METQTPLHQACINGHIQIVQYLVEKGSNIEAKDQYQQTSLHIASYWGRTDVVKYLVSKGANKNAKDADGKTPYDIVCNGIGTDKLPKDIIRKLFK